MASDSRIHHFISETRRKPVPINVDDDDDDGDDENEMDVDASDGHSSIPVTCCRLAPATSKDARDIESETESESGRKSSEDEDELHNEDPDDLDLLHLDKASLKEKISSEVRFL